MDKKEINRINTLIALIVLIMIGIPCVYFLVNRVCYVCTIDNSFQNISKKYEQVQLHRYWDIVNLRLSLL